MILERRRMAVGGLVVSIVALVSVAGVAVGGLGIDRGPIATFERTDGNSQQSERTVSQRLAQMDEALGRKELSRAIYDWHDAYGLALGSRRWEAMLSVGDAALRIDAVASKPVGHPGRFQAEARQAYLRALFQARGARSQDGIDRVAHAFAALGDTEMATRARAIRVSR